MELRRLGFGCLDISQERLSPPLLRIVGHTVGIDLQSGFAIEAFSRNQKMGISGLRSAVDFPARDALPARHLLRREPGVGSGG